MPITYKTLVDFVARNGNVRIFPTKGVRLLKSRQVDFVDLIGKAKVFGYGSRRYTRAGFEKLMNEKNQ